MTAPAPPPLPPLTGPVVAVLVDGSTAAPVAARWAAGVARDTGRLLLALVLHEEGADPDDAVALAARVEPALHGGGRPVTVVRCVVRGPRAGAAAVRAALEGTDVALLVCPASSRLPALVAELVAAPPADLLVVPPGALPHRHAGVAGASW